jgi:hypothetical protein
MYMFRPLPVNEILTVPMADHVAISHAGHGVNSYTINYSLVYRDLAIFFQVPWGGVYNDNDAAAARLAAMFVVCGKLIELAEQRPHGGESAWRLICMDSSIRRYSACGWVHVPRPDLAREDGFPREFAVEPNTSLDVAERLYRVGVPVS